MFKKHSSTCCLIFKLAGLARDPKDPPNRTRHPSNLLPFIRIAEVAESPLAVQKLVLRSSKAVWSVPRFPTHLPSFPMSTPVDTRAYYATSATSAIEAGSIQRRAVQPHDVSIKIHYCGICHTDLHMARNEFGMSKYPLVPGHEIVGVVDAVGSEVTKFKVGDRVGVGCIAETCGTCDRCTSHYENHCQKFSMTYGSEDRIGNLGITQGGYSERIITQDKYVLSIPDNLDFAAAAPLLCAGITVYTPLIEGGAGPGKRVGVLGVGGLGHMVLKLGKALGAQLVAFTSKAEKKDELLALGADEVIVTSDAAAVAAAQGTIDIIIDTVSGDHNIIPIMNTLKFRGIYSTVGAAPLPLAFASFPLLMNKITITGSAIGSIQSTQDMLDLCGKHNITSTVEVVPLKNVNEAFHRLEKGDVRFRFVLDVIGEYGN